MQLELIRLYICRAIVAFHSIFTNEYKQYHKARQLKSVLKQFKTTIN